MSHWKFQTTPLPARIYANEGACQFLFLKGTSRARPAMPIARAIYGPAWCDAAQIMIMQSRRRLAGEKVPFCPSVLPGPAQAQQAVALKSTVYVARPVTDAQGNKKNQLFAPDRVLPGEALVIMLEYKNNGTKPAADFVINNPIPGAVSFTGVEQPWAVVSVDGGRTYGALAALKVAKGDARFAPALPGDVTHVRWKFARAIAPGANGRVMFDGTVKYTSYARRKFSLKPCALTTGWIASGLEQTRWRLQWLACLLGRLFFKAQDPAGLQDWHACVLGLEFHPWGGTVFIWKLLRPIRFGTTLRPLPARTRTILPRPTGISCSISWWMTWMECWPDVPVWMRFGQDLPG